MNSKKVEKAVNVILKARATWEEKKATVIEMLSKMTDDDRQEWYKQVKEAMPHCNSLWQRMLASSKRGWVGATHLYGDVAAVSHRDIEFATGKGAETLKNPEAVIKVATPTGGIEKVKVSEATRNEMSQAWDKKTGQVPIAKQRERIAKRAPKPLEADKPSKVLSAKTEGDHVLLTVQGMSREVKLTKNDLKNLLGMFI
jgi:hypothetical protein